MFERPLCWFRTLDCEIDHVREEAVRRVVREEKHVRRVVARGN